ncbi:hypothetical protein EJB05_07135, partial [Eragrostis curvula]
MPPTKHRLIGRLSSATFHAARPPAFSFFSVYCPGIPRPGKEPEDIFLKPKFVSQDADLVVLCVPRDMRARMENFFSDYFVYRVNPERPKLDLLPNPFPAALEDNEIAVLSCGDEEYVVAALRIMSGSDDSKPTFKLRLYRSTTNGETGIWTSQELSLEEPMRDKVCPIPETAERQMYHRTTKVITLGDENGTIGWVDLWRGIILCDVLSERPKLRDLPLPLPAEGNLSYFLNYWPSYFRDITVNQRKDTIKYVEMEITPPQEMFLVPSGSDDSDSDDSDSDDSVHYQGVPHSIDPGTWTATTWAMPIPAASWNDWRPGCSVSLDSLRIPSGKRRVHKSLDRILTAGCFEEQEATGARATTLSLGCLCVSYPTLSILDDDVLYILSTGTRMESIGALVNVDVRAKTLKGVQELGTNRGFYRHFRASGISQLPSFSMVQSTDVLPVVMKAYVLTKNT